MSGRRQYPQLIQVAYDRKRRRLTVWFASGRRRTHPDIPQKTYEQMILSRSPHEYYARNVAGGTRAFRARYLALTFGIAAAAVMVDLI